MTQTIIQNTFVAGELTPNYWGRTDQQKYRLGATTCRNFFINYTGGASSRAGFQYCGMTKQAAPNIGGTSTNNPPRVIRFQFNINQGYALEFGDQYMRILSDGAYVVEPAKNITGATNANPMVITSASHGYSNGDWVYIQNMGGLTELNGLTWIVTNVTTNTFHLTDLFGNVVNSTSYAAYTSGGTAERLYTAVSPYAAVDLPYLKFTQSADVMSLCCINTATLTEYPPYDLERLGNADWVFTQTTYASAIEAPPTITVTAQSSTTLSTYYSYVVTAVNANGEESVASPVGTVENNDISVNAGSNTISWSAVVGATSYNVYGAVPSYGATTPIGSSFGYLGNSFGTQFIDTNITADFAQVPPTHQNPFAPGAITFVTPTAGGSGLSQSTIGYEITTSTGTGFSGFPIIVNGNFVGFFIENNGQNYLGTDTITITTGGAAATGSYTFVANPTNGQTVIFNGVTWTFVTSVTGIHQTKIGLNLADTLTQFVSDLTTSGNSSLTEAGYSSTGTVVDITFGEQGTVGNAYTLAAGSYGGTVSGANLSGGSNGSPSGATASLVVGPETGVNPAVPFYFEQRRGYANTLNQPDTYFFSKPGEYQNMDSSIPTVDDDAIIGTPWAQQVNGIQWGIPMPNGLIVGTGNGGWLLSGVNGNAFTATSQFAIQQANIGFSALVPPILINSDILYIQSKNSIMRDLTYNFFTNIYMGEDKTILANHLFMGHTILQWAYAEEPYKIVWAIREDGIMLSLTWLKEQDIWGWARHDTDGIFTSICTVTELPVDAVYVIVKRYVNGGWVYYSERANNRIWETVEDSFCVDAGLSYPMPEPAATLTPAAAKGTSNISSTIQINGGSGYTSPQATAVDSTGAGSGATFTVTVSGGVITAVTPSDQGDDYTEGETSIVITDPTGTGAIFQPVITNIVNFTASTGVFNSGDVGNVIRVGGGIATITGYTSSTVVQANITQPITETLPNDPNNMPIPAVAGNWTMTTPTMIVTGLNHLNGMTVTGLADGAVITPLTVGAVTGGIGIVLQQAASAINVGLGFTAQLQGTYLDPQGQPGGTGQSKRKLISDVAVRVVNSRGFSVGSNQIDASTLPDGVNNTPWIDMVEVKDRNNLIDAGNAIPLMTKDYYMNINNAWNEYSHVAVQTTNPLPCNVTAVITYFTEGDSAG